MADPELEWSLPIIIGEFLLFLEKTHDVMPDNVGLVVDCCEWVSGREDICSEYENIVKFFVPEPFVVVAVGINIGVF